MLPFDHIHLNEPAAEASQWWEKNIPGGRRITEAPNRIMYGAVRLMFLGARSTGGSDGSVIEHLGFSVPDLDATMRALAAIDTKVIEPVKTTPGLYKTAMIESPWGTRVQLVQDPELLGLHHVQLRSPDPDGDVQVAARQVRRRAHEAQRSDRFGEYTGIPGFTTVYILAAKGSSVPSQGRAIDHIGWRSIGTIAETKTMLEGEERAAHEPAAPARSPEWAVDQLLLRRGPRRRTHRDRRTTRPQAGTMNCRTHPFQVVARAR